HLGVLGRERLREQRTDLARRPLLIVYQLVEALRSARRGLGEVVVLRVVAEATDAFEDLCVALREKGECFGIEFHGLSSCLSRIAPVATASPGVRASMMMTLVIAS